MLVEKQDGQCRTCGGQLKIIDADDATMTVECQSPDCGDSYALETDAFNDGAMHYYPQYMLRRMMEGEES